MDVSSADTGHEPLYRHTRRPQPFFCQLVSHHVDTGKPNEDLSVLRLVSLNLPARGRKRLVSSEHPTNGAERWPSRSVGALVPYEKKENLMRFAVNLGPTGD